MNGQIAQTSGDTPAARKPRLLLTEDDPGTRDFLCEVLREDYDVQVAADGQGAWAAVQNESPTLLLADVVLPGMDGIRLTRRLRADPRTRTLPIILLTTSHERELLVQGLRAGADDFLLKPVDAGELLVRLHAHLALIEVRRHATTHASDERYRAIVESARDYAIFTYDADRRITTWNLGAEALTGYPTSEILGQSVDVVFTPEDREQGVPATEAEQAHEVGRFYNERWHLKKDGSRFWGSGVVMPLRESGPERSCLKILRDETQTHEAEEERARLLASEQAARQEAETANAAKDCFLAALSHELRAPLTPIQMAVYLMARTKDLPASVQDGLALIRRNVEVETQLISDLLDVSRITHGKLELNRTPVDLHDCIRHALEVSDADFTGKALRLTVALDAHDPHVLGEATRLQQVFWNLFKNAAKFTPQGGTVTVRSHNQDGDVLVEVADTGAGIEADALAKIFEPFEQGGQERTRRYGGLGLGLAISQAIVAAHEGELTAQSAGKDQGATFLVRLSTMAKEAMTASAR